METTHSEAATRLLHNIQSSTRPEDGDNPLEGSNKIAPQHTIIHSPRIWRQPTRGQQQDSSTTYNHPLAPKMETTHSEVTIRLLHNIQPCTRPEDGDNPLGGSNKIAPQHTTMHSPRRWRQLTRRHQQDRSTTYIHPSIRPANGISLTRRWQQDFSAPGISPTRKSVYTFRC